MSLLGTYEFKVGQQVICENTDTGVIEYGTVADILEGMYVDMYEIECTSGMIIHIAVDDEEWEIQNA